MRKKGSNAAKHEEMLSQAFELILYKGWSYNEFRDNFSKLNGITERQAENYWRQCKQKIVERNKDNINEILEAQIPRYMDLLSRCKTDGNKRTEREVLSDLNKIFGIETKKIDITSGGEKINISINLTE